MKNQIVLFIAYFFISLHPLFANEEDKTEQWTTKMNQYLAEVPLNIDSIHDKAIQHIDTCPLKGDLKAAYYHSLMAEVYYYKQDIDESLNAYQHSLKLFETSGDSSRSAVLYNNIGLIYYLKADYDKALNAYNESLQWELKGTNKTGIAQSYQNLGMISSKYARYDEALSYYAEALKIYEDLEYVQGIGDINNNMAVMAVRKNDNKLAFKHYKNAFDAFVNLNDSTSMAKVASNLGNLFHYEGQIPRAKEYFNVALEVFKANDDKVNLVHTYSMIGEMYLTLNDLDKAIEAYDLADKYNAEIGLVELEMDNRYDLYEAFKKNGDYESALIAYERYIFLNDSILNNEAKYKVVELEKKFHSEKSQKELLILRAKQERTRLYMWGLSIFFLLSTIIALIWVNVLKIKEKQRSITMEHKVLRTQMNPHFIFNSLSALQCIIMENNRDEAMDFVADFSNLMRLVLQYAKEETITLKKEKEILEKYMSLQNRRFDNKINYKINFDEQMPLEQIVVPPMLAQPFLENAIEHGQLTKEDSYIHVNLKRKNDKLEFAIEDNGIGIKNSMKQKQFIDSPHKSFALKLTKERLKLLNNKDRNGRITFRIEDLSESGMKGTRVVFQVPYMELN